MKSDTLIFPPYESNFGSCKSEVKKGEDYQAIRKAIDDLNQGTMRLAELMMDSAVSSALKGKTMDEADLGEGPDAPHPMAKAEFE